MPRISGYRSSWKPNKRPYVTMAPDAYVAVQGETTVIGCGECRREIDINKYVTGISTESTVDSPPGSATINLSIPDNQVNQFYVNDGFIIIPMMEIEIYAKGYYTVGGFPQYYKIFWGLVSTVSQNWSNGVTSISIQCKDILRWWELTQSIVNPAFLDIGKSASGYNMWGNKFAGANPYTVILILARESMGDFPLSDGSFLSSIPEKGREGLALKEFASSIMAYWQLKFSNIWNRLVLYGTSGQAYTFQGMGNKTPAEISNAIFMEESKTLNLNAQTAQFKNQPHEIAAFKQELSRAGDVDFFQNEFQSKLSLALTARDQAGAYEFYCDTTGDIIFKPPFYNMNVIPNKPISWIQDFEIIDDGITDTEAEIYTHITSSGNAFGGVMDYGLNDDITTPRTGVIDYHLLRRYGWRRLNIQVEWAGNARKLFYYLLDQMDKINSKRISGSITIPMRPELRMGFPVWIPKYDSFFYVQGIAHNFSPGGQATSTLSLTAKRSKFIAPKNIGMMKITPGSVPKDKNTVTYEISFPSNAGETSGAAVPGGTTGGDQNSGASQAKTDGLRFDAPAIVRDPENGRLLGFPNAVMVYRNVIDNVKMTKLLAEVGSVKGDNPQPGGTQYDNRGKRPDLQGQTLERLNSEQRYKVIDQLRAHRYESGMSSAGIYDYAHDVDSTIKEFSVVPTTSISWAGKETTQKSDEVKAQAARNDAIKKKQELNANLAKLEQKLSDAQIRFKSAQASQTSQSSSAPVVNNEQNKSTKGAETNANVIQTEINSLQGEIMSTKTNMALVDLAIGSGKLSALNAMIRPVSDEYGFEVIGHYRYGRGTFIDRGRVKTLYNSDGSNNKNPQVINQLNVQFASTGGALTDVIMDKTLGPESVSFAKAFEELQPDDYRTGASFKGKQYNQNELYENVKVTGETQYTTSINKTLSDTTGVYAEADAVRRAITLAELQPTFSGFSTIDGRSAFTKCACGIGRFLWLSVLPKEFLQKLLTSTTATETHQTESEDPEYAYEETKQLVEPPKNLTGGGDLRNKAADLANSWVNFMSGPGGTQQKYMDLLFPADRDPVWRVDPNWDKTQSCALVARAMLRELGLQDPELQGPYKQSNTRSAITDIRDIGRRHGSITENGNNNPLTERPDLRPGDIIFCGKPGDDSTGAKAFQHTIIVTEILPAGSTKGITGEDYCVLTTEGGQRPYNRSIKLTPAQEEAAAKAAAGGALSLNQARGVLMTSPGIVTKIKRCITKQNGKWYVGGYGTSAPILFTIDLEKTFADTSVANVENNVASNVDAATDAYENRNRKSGGKGKAEEQNNLLTTGDNFSLDSAKFFELLYNYLTLQFAENYIAGNTPREKFAIAGNMPIVTPPAFEQDNILHPGNSLFDRAAQGDPDALNALKRGTNFNFGQSAEGLKTFKDQFKDSGQVGKLWQNTEDLAGQLYDPGSGNFQPPGGVSISTVGPSGRWGASTYPSTGGQPSAGGQPSTTGSGGQWSQSPTGQWSANASSSLPDGSTAEGETAKAIDSGNAQSTKLPTISIQTIKGKKNAELPKALQKGQWQPPSHPTLRTKLNITAPNNIIIGPVLRKNVP